MDRSAIDSYALRVRTFQAAASALEQTIGVLEEDSKASPLPEDHPYKEIRFGDLKELIHNTAVEAEIVRQELDELASEG